MNTDYKKYIDKVEESAGKACRLADDIWGYAETAFSEDRSSAELAYFFEKEGFKVTRPACGIKTALIAEYGHGKPIIGLLGEFDALSNLNQKSGSLVKEADQPGANGHGCGHNLLGAGSAAAALAVKAYLEDGHEGTIRYYGCPGEEGGSGKAFMAREGAFSDLDCALTWHPDTMNCVVRDSSLANIQVLFRFYGTSSHAAASPEMGRSALDAMEIMNVGTNFLREHMLQEARIHYAVLDSGGRSPNVVQNYASVLYLIRAPKVGETQALFERVKKIAYGAAYMTETRYEAEFIKSCANLVPNSTLEKALFESMNRVGLPAFTEEEYELAEKYTATVEPGSNHDIEGVLSRSAMAKTKDYLSEVKSHRINDFVNPYDEVYFVRSEPGSTDVGDVSWMCPTAQIHTATWAPSTPAHSWQAVSQNKSSQAHKGMLYAARAMADCALHLYSSPALLEEARKEWEEKLRDQTYVPIPDGVMPKSIASLG